MAVGRSVEIFFMSLTTARRMPGVRMRRWSLTSMVTAGIYKVLTDIPSSNSLIPRYVHSHERRDWAWWESVRNYMYSMGNSW